MDAKKVGEFISALRKEKNMTQAELAKKLQVTDKAVSRWERGVGLPDINTIEPLADALGVSIVEIMKGERVAEGSVSRKEADGMLSDTFYLSRKEKGRTLKKVVLASLLAAGGIFLAGVGLYLYWRESFVISLVGGADGPTSVFIAGKINTGFCWFIVGLGILAAAAGIVTLIKMKK